MSENSAEHERLRRESAYRELFTTYFTRIARYVERRLGENAIAEDIAAEVFQVAWQGFDPDDPPTVPWLFRTAMNKTNDALRVRYRTREAFESVAQSIEDSRDSVPQRQLDALDAAMDGLSQRDREMVRLTYWDELSAGEVADVLGMREGTVWTRLHRVRARLRAILEAPETGGGDA